jgi:hypothetical protein
MNCVYGVMRNSYQGINTRIKSSTHYALLILKETMKTMLTMGRDWIMNKSLPTFKSIP